MPDARRLTVALVVLTGVFFSGVVLAVGWLLARHDPGLAVVCVVALLAGAVAAGLSLLAARSVRDDEQADGLLAPDPGTVRQAATQPLPASRAQPLRVQALPIADLPEPYLAAVMKGLQANRAALQEAQRK